MTSASFVEEVNEEIQEIEFEPLDEEDEAEPPADSADRTNPPPPPPTGTPPPERDGRRNRGRR